MQIHSYGIRCQPRPLGYLRPSGRKDRRTHGGSRRAPRQRGAPRCGDPPWCASTPPQAGSSSQARQVPSPSPESIESGKSSPIKTRAETPPLTASQHEHERRAVSSASRKAAENPDGSGNGTLDEGRRIPEARENRRRCLQEIGQGEDGMAPLWGGREWAHARQRSSTAVARWRGRVPRRERWKTLARSRSPCGADWNEAVTDAGAPGPTAPTCALRPARQCLG